MPGNGCTSHTTSARLRSTWRAQGPERDSLAVLNLKSAPSQRSRCAQFAEPPDLLANRRANDRCVLQQGQLFFQHLPSQARIRFLGRLWEPALQKRWGRTLRPQLQLHMVPIDLCGRIEVACQGFAQAAAHSLFLSRSELLC